MTVTTFAAAVLPFAMLRCRGRDVSPVLQVCNAIAIAVLCLAVASAERTLLQGKLPASWPLGPLDIPCRQDNLLRDYRRLARLKASG